jgi:hypothetical protein
VWRRRTVHSTSLTRPFYISQPNPDQARVTSQSAPGAHRRGGCLDPLAHDYIRARRERVRRDTGLRGAENAERPVVRLRSTGRLPVRASAR